MFVRGDEFNKRHSMTTANQKKSKDFVTNTTAASKYIPRRPRIIINWNPTFQTSLHKISKVIFFRLTIFFSETKKSFQRTTFIWFLYIVMQKKKSKIYFIKKVWKGGFQLMLILGLLGIYFDAAVVFVTKYLYSDWL